MRGSKVSIRILQLRRLLELSSIVELPGVSPRAVEIRGNRLELASGVEINGMDAPAFMALGSGRLLVQVPVGMLGQVTEVAVFSDYLDPGGSSLAFYDLGKHPWMTQGKYRVLQNFVKLLMTTPGSDIFSPSSGGGLQQLIVRNVSPGSEPAISGEIETKTMAVTNQIIQSQALDPTIPAAERLLSSSIDNILVSAPQGTVSVSLSLRFHDGTKISTAVGW
jgi:hypothetical protein